MSKDLVTIDPSVHSLTAIQNIDTILNQYPAILESIENAFPGNLSHDERTRKAWTLATEAKIAIRLSKKPDKILECRAETIIDCMIQTARCGLSLRPQAAEAYLVPYSSNCTLMIGYKGYITLLYSCGMRKIDMALVYDGDEIEIIKGSNPSVRHKTCLTTERTVKNVIGGWLLAVLPSGEKVVVEMDRGYMNRIKDCSKAGQGIYSKWPEAMMLKGLIRYAQKYLPKVAEAPELKTYFDAIEIDEQHDKKILEIDERISDDRSATATAVDNELETPSVPEESELLTAKIALRDAIQKQMAWDVPAANNYMTTLATKTLDKGTIDSEEDLQRVSDAHYGEGEE